nr:T9SS type A sorting domain-containing protein [Bacteroidota bacterium]
GTTTTGTLQFITANSINVNVGLGGVNITSNGDVSGTTTGTQITTTGDVILNKVISNTNLTLTTQTTSGIDISGTGGVANLTNNIATTNSGNIAVSNTLTTGANLTNNGTITAAIVTANNTLTNNGTLNITSTSGGATANKIVNAAAGLIDFSGCTVSRTMDLTAIGNTMRISNTSVACGGSWTFTGISTSFYNLIIQGTATKAAGNPITINGDLTIQSGGVLNTNANNIILAGNWINNDGSAGSFVEGTRTVTLNGTTDQTITNTSGETFNNLIINKASGEVILQAASSATVSGTLTMTAGNINLNGRTLTLGTAVGTLGTLSYTDGIIFTDIASGGFQRWVGTGSALTSTTGLFPVGYRTDYRPLVITSTSAPTTGGTITVYHTNASGVTVVSPTFVDNAGTVDLMSNSTHTVSQSGLVTAGTFSMKISGTGYGTIGDVDDLRIIRSAGTIAPGADGVHAGTTLDPQVNRTGLSAANLNNTFTLGTVNSTRTPLPIELLSFTADPVNNSYTRVKWTTATETNNDFFTVEKSRDGINFENIGIVDGGGNTISVLNYSLIDDSPYKGVSYYRLKQTDFDGKFSYSHLIAVEFGNNIDNFRFNLYPNPINIGENIIFSIKGNVGDEVIVVVYDVTGKKNYSKVLIMETEDNSIYAIDESKKLPPGIYMVTATSDQTIYSKKLIVK